MNFVKTHGLGNDFVLIDCRAMDVEPVIAAAQKLCDRHFGIGADGLLLVLDSNVADIRMRIINSDGSEAEMCGNGIRCFAKYVYEQKIVEKTSLTVETLAGIMGPRIITDDAGIVTGVEVDMGEPILERSLIPMIGEGKAISTPIMVDGKEFIVTAVSMGNPHCVIYVDDAVNYPVEEWGPKLEKCAYFPKKTNVHFVQVLNDHEVVMRVWERGAAVTLACGTGSCAVTTACVLNNKTGRNILLHLDGGDLQVRWDEATNRLFMTGPAEEVFRGTVEL